MIPNLNLHQLHSFYCVVRHGGLSQALPHLPQRIGQAALSQQILLLEQTVGRKLFHRRPFRLQPAGFLIYERCRAFFESLPRLAREIDSLLQPRLRVAVSDVAYACAISCPSSIARLRPRCR